MIAEVVIPLIVGALLRALLDWLTERRQTKPSPTGEPWREPWHAGDERRTHELVADAEERQQSGADRG